MADVLIDKFRVKVVRQGTTPANPGNVTTDPLPPVNPEGTAGTFFGVGAGLSLDSANKIQLGDFIGVTYIKPTGNPSIDNIHDAQFNVEGSGEFYSRTASGDKQSYLYSGLTSLETKFSAETFWLDKYTGFKGYSNGTAGNTNSRIVAETYSSLNSEYIGYINDITPTGLNSVLKVETRLFGAGLVRRVGFQFFIPKSTYVSVNTFTDSVSNKGLVYAGDYETNFTARSLVTKQYVDGVVTGGYVPTSRTITINGTTQDLSANRTWNVGTVTSVSLSAPLGFVVSGSPVTSTGTLALAFDTGYSLPTNAKQAEWDTAYTNRITSLTTTGNSGAATLISNVLNIPNYTLSGLGGEPSITAGTTAQYWRGDKTWQTLNTSVVPELTNLYFTESRVLATPLTGYTVGSNTALAATDTILQAFGKVQGQINARISGTIASGQVAFGTGVNTIGGDSGIIWDNANKRLNLVKTDTNATIRFITTENTGGSFGRIEWKNDHSTTYPGIAAAISSGIGNFGASPFLAFFTNTDTRIVGALVERWRVTSTGVLQSNGAQSIQTSTGNLTLATAGGNGNILLTPNGTGFVMIGSGTPTNLLDVNGTARIRTVSNATGNFVTLSATGVLQQRTAAEVRTDIGAEPSFGKGDLVQGNGVSLSGTLLSRLVSSGNVTISHGATGGFSKTSLTGANVISNLTVDSFGHLTDWTTRALTVGDIGAVPTTRTLTINGTTFDLSADRSWTVSTVDTNKVSYNTNDSKTASERIQARINIGSTSATPQIITTAGAINDLSTTSNHLVFTGASVVLSGIVAGLDGEEITILNASGTNLEVLSSSALSLAENRFISGLIVPNLSILRIKYRTNTARWVLENVGINDGRYLRKDIADTKTGTLIVNSGSTSPSVSILSLRNSTPITFFNVLSNGRAFYESSISSIEQEIFRITNTSSGYTLRVVGQTGSIALMRGDARSDFDCNVIMSESRNFGFGTTTGTKIGTATTQKLAFWNATPIVQPTNAIAAAAFVANTSGIADDTATFGGYTLGQVVQALRNIGILA